MRSSAAYPSVAVSYVKNRLLWQANYAYRASPVRNEMPHLITQNRVRTLFELFDRESFEGSGDKEDVAMPGRIELERLLVF